jgi:hypothetical protein
VGGEWVGGGFGWLGGCLCLVGGVDLGVMRYLVVCGGVDVGGGEVGGVGSWFGVGGSAGVRNASTAGRVRLVVCFSPDVT